MRRRIIQEPFDYGVPFAVEAAFSEAEHLAGRLAETVKTLGLEINKFQSASKVGNLLGVRKARQTITTLGRDLHALIEMLESFDAGAISRAINSRSFLQEIIDAARAIGFDDIRISGTAILAFPNRIVIDEKGIKIGRKAVPNTRPTSLAAILKSESEQARKAPTGFIDALLNAYEQKCPSGSTPVSLTEIYELLTLFPDVRKTYGEADFVRDLSMIDAFGPHKSRDGRRITFVASTATRMGKGYRAVSPTGEEVTYGSIRFVRPD